MRNVKSITFKLKVRREVIPSDGNTARVVPRLSVPRGVVHRLDANEVDEIREQALDAYDESTVLDMVAQSQESRREEYVLGTVEVSQSAVTFKPNERRL